MTIGAHRTLLPIFYRDLAYLGLFLTAPLDRIRSLLPSARMHPYRLTPWHGLVTITASQYRESDLGPYNGLSIGVPFVLDRASPLLTGILRPAPEVPMIYLLQLPVSTETARAVGVEIANYPEFLADIRFDSDDRWIHCRVDAEGKNILSLSGRKLGLRPHRRERVYPVTVRQNRLLRSELNYSDGQAGISRKPSDIRLEFGGHPIGLQMKEMRLGRLLQYQYYPAGQAVLSTACESYQI